MWEDKSFAAGSSGPNSSMNRGGGGFMQQSTNSFDSPSQKKPVARAQNVVPLLARQIMNCKDDDFTLFGMPVQIAVVFGILRTLDVHSIKATCQIEDHSAPIEAVLWLPNEDDAKNSIISKLKIGHYVRACGSIRNQSGGKKMLMLLKIEPVESLNAITTHLLEVIHTRLAADAMSKRTRGVNVPGRALANSMTAMEIDTNTSNNAPANNTNKSTVSLLQDKVIRIIKAVDTVAGIHINDILNKFTSSQEREVRNCLDFLINEGHVYTTVDSQHYRATGNNME